jgi:transposase-like protein
MAKTKRHSRAEIATKLAEANKLAREGKSQSEIAHTLGVSVVTLHRWREKANRTRGADERIDELQIENSRLRRLITDLLLEKAELEEHFR